MQYIFIILMFITSLNASDYIIDGKLQTFTLPDQFEKTHTIDKSIRTIIVSFEKSTGADVNSFLNEHEPDYLQKHNAVFVANISEMPSLITKLFAMPKMKKYKHTILIINDEENHQFLYQEDKITVYTLDNGVVSSIEYVDTVQDVEKRL
jgi:hypothetical protein